MQKDDDLIREILDFWFSAESSSKWFNSTAEFDDLIRHKYEKIWGLARAESFDHWEQEPEGALALVIILDQFPLNMFRLDARQYSTEAHARKIALHAISNGFDKELARNQQPFLYLPFMHSESLDDQNTSVNLYEKAGLKDNLKFAKHHREVVKRFGRFPHRNEIYGRHSTEDEIEYLKHANW